MLRGKNDSLQNDDQFFMVLNNKVYVKQTECKNIVIQYFGIYNKIYANNVHCKYHLLKLLSVAVSQGKQTFYPLHLGELCKITV